MQPLPAAQRVELSPAVKAVLQATSPNATFLKNYVRYMEALLDPDQSGIDVTATPDAHCHELDAMGIPPGREGLKIYRRQVNGAIPDEHVLIADVRFEGDNFIEADLQMTATATGPFMGIPGIGQKLRFEVQERCRFADGKLAERWAKLDLEDIKRQLMSPP
jgi:predicted ester cyclase